MAKQEKKQQRANDSEFATEFTQSKKARKRAARERKNNN